MKRSFAWGVLGLAVTGCLGLPPAPPPTKTIRVLTINHG